MKVELLRRALDDAFASHVNLVFGIALVSGKPDPTAFARCRGAILAAMSARDTLLAACTPECDEGP